MTYRVNMKWMPLLLMTQVLALSTWASGNISQRVVVEEAMRRANDYFLANFSVGSAVWDRNGYHTGNFRARETLRIQAYYERSVAWGEANSWLRGPEGTSHADAHCCGQTYIDLYNVDPQSVRTNNITDTLNDVLTSTYYQDDWWIDAFYMAGSTYARLRGPARE